MSRGYRIEISTQASAEEAQRLSRGIVDFNRHAVPELETVESERRFFVLARDADGRVVGGIRAVCYWNTLHLELVWLDEASRGERLGSGMLAEAEAYARDHGYEQALVETTSWQARPFYEKAGYVHVATIPDRPRGHASHYLRKRLVVPSGEVEP